MVMKGYSTFTKALALLEPHHRLFRVISRTLVVGGECFTLLQRCSQCILKPQPTGPEQTMDHKSEGDTNFNWCAPYSYQRIGTGFGGLGNKRMSGDYRNFCISKIGRDPERNPGDLRRLAVTQTPVGNVGVKNLQRSNVIKKRADKRINKIPDSSRL